MFVTLLKLPQTAGPPLHPVMLQATPRLVGSLVTVAVKSWLPLVRRLAVVGTTETETAGRPPSGAVVSEPQAASSKTPMKGRKRCGICWVFMIAPIRGSKTVLLSLPTARSPMPARC